MKHPVDAHVKSVNAIKCRFCPEKFVKGKDMNAHVTSVHYLKCQFCPAKCLKKKDMDQHITKVHICNDPWYNSSWKKKVWLIKWSFDRPWIKCAVEKAQARNILIIASNQFISSKEDISATKKIQC